LFKEVSNRKEKEIRIQVQEEQHGDFQDSRVKNRKSGIKLLDEVSSWKGPINASSKDETRSTRQEITEFPLDPSLA
jgi:hypothetical protein